MCPTAASGILHAHRIVSRSGRISVIPMTPPTSMMRPQIMNPVLKPSSGDAAVSMAVLGGAGDTLVAVACDERALVAALKPAKGARATLVQCGFGTACAVVVGGA